MFKNAIQDVFIQSQANTRFPSYLTNITNKISNDTFAQYSFEYIFASRANLPNFTKKDHHRIKTLILLYARLLHGKPEKKAREAERCEMDTDRCSRSRSVATMPWASPRGCCRCRWPLARTVTRQSGCFGCCCCYRCCYRFLRCQLVMQPTNQKTSYCQPPNSFLPVASGRFSPYRHSSIVALSRFSKSFFSTNVFRLNLLKENFFSPLPWRWRVFESTEFEEEDNFERDFSFLLNRTIGFKMMGVEKLIFY